MVLIHDKGRFSLRRVLTGLTEIDRISWLSHDVLFLDLTLIPLSLPYLIVGHSLRSRRKTATSAVIQAKVALRHAIPRFLLITLVTLQSFQRRGLVHDSRASLWPRFISTKREVRRAKVSRLFCDLSLHVLIRLGLLVSGSGVFILVPVLL